MNTENIEEIAIEDESEEITVNVEDTETEVDADELEESEDDDGIVYREYKLQHGHVRLFLERPDAENVGSLPIEDLVTLAEQALAQWSYRGGSKKSNHMKRFRLSEIITAMRTKTVKVGKPSKDDGIMADAFMKKTKGQVDLAHADLSVRDRADKCHDLYMAFIVKMEEKYAFETSGLCVYDKDHVAGFFRCLRLAKARAVKKELEF